MATNKVLMTPGAGLIFSNSTYLAGSDATKLGVYEAAGDIDVVGLTAGQARSSIKRDLGASHAESYSVDASFETASDTAAGDSLDLYWSESHSTTAALGNIGGPVGTDVDFAGYSTLTLAESLLQMTFIGSLPIGINAPADGVQIGHVGIFSPVQQYGILVYHWNTVSIAMHTDSIECAVRFTPIVPDIQAAT